MSIGESIKSAGNTVGGFVVGAATLAGLTVLGAGVAVAAAGLGVFLVATIPVASLLSQPINLTKLAAYGAFKSYHKSHSKDENGVAIGRKVNGQPAYMTSSEFKVSDLSRLQHEKKRLNAKVAYHTEIVSERRSLKGLIPVIGIIWIYKTEDMQHTRDRVPVESNKSLDYKARIERVESIIHQLNAQSVSVK